MPELKKFYAGAYLKIGDTCEHGDTIKFTNAGSNEGSVEEPKIQFVVEVSRKGKVLSEKKFSLNKTNFMTVAKAYGTNSDKWVGKEFVINSVKVRSPKSGELVDGIVLSLPNHDEEGEVVTQ